MKKFAVRISLPLMVVLAGLAQQPAAQLRSPEVHPDRRVTFRLAAPKAGEVKLTGEFMKDAQTLKKDDKGVWSATVGPIRPDIYAYEFSVDGLRVVDPSNPSLKYSSRADTTSSMVEVPGDGPMFYDTRAVPHGTVQARLYSSKSLDRERRLYVYTPPGYERSTARYPVLYLLHGASGDDSIWTWIGHANLILDNLMADGKLKPLVVVMPDGYAYPPIGPVPAGANQRAGFERDLLGDILPFVQTNYRVYADRDHRAIAGLSMGGGQALSIGLGHLDLFSRVAGFSSALVGQNNFRETYAGLVGNPRKANDQLKLLWTGCGTDDTLFNANKPFADFLESSNIKHTFRPSEGAHTWQVWRRYLAEVAPLLFPHS